MRAFWQHPARLYETGTDPTNQTNDTMYTIHSDSELYELYSRRRTEKNISLPDAIDDAHAAWLPAWRWHDSKPVIAFLRDWELKGDTLNGTCSAARIDGTAELGHPQVLYFFGRKQPGNPLFNFLYFVEHHLDLNECEARVTPKCLEHFGVEGKE